MGKHSIAARNQAYVLIAASIRTTMIGMQEAGMLNTDIARVMAEEARVYERKGTLNNRALRKVVSDVSQSVYVSPPERVD